MTNQQIPEIQEIILSRIGSILRETYKEDTAELTVSNVGAKLAFKSDPHLNELRLALERIAREDYGNCIFCKEPISATLLKNHPTAHFCGQCDIILRYRTGTDGTMQPDAVGGQA